MNISNFSSKATGPLVTNFHKELPWADVKFLSNSPGHMTNMVAMPTHGKNLNTLLLWN